MPELWAGVDIGKEYHHCVVIDAQGRRLFSRRVLNGEQELLELIGDVLAPSNDAQWAVDIKHGGVALLIGLLLGHGQPIVYLTGLAVHRAAGAYRGQGKTDAKDTFVIADQARMRTDLGVLRPGDDIAVVLRTLTRRPTDLVNDRTRQINRLRDQLLEFFPALERVMGLTNKEPVRLLTGYQTPAAIRRSGAKRIESWLQPRGEGCRQARPGRRRGGQGLRGETLAAEMVARIAKGLVALHKEIAELDALIEARFRQHRTPR